MNTTTIENKASDFRKIDKLEPAWLYELKKNAWISYNETPTPNRVIHLWRYTDPAAFTVNGDNNLQNISRTTTEGVEPSPAFLDPSFSKTGIVFKDILSAARENEEITGEHLGGLVGSDFGKFEALNLALWNSGLFLYIPDNAIVKKPIHLLRRPVGPLTLFRLLIVVGKNAEVTIIDDYSGESNNNDALVNSAVEVYAGDSSNVHYANIQRFGDGIRSYATQRAKIGRDARMYSLFGGLGGGLIKVNAGTILAGRGADSRMQGVVFTDGNQHFDYHTLHHHRENESYSDIDFKVILKDRSTSAYTGLIRIDEYAFNCQAYQMNRNLLLNKGPKAESIPELEILCDQVSCSHGATMAPIDPELLFYLKSRGINHDDAVKSIVSGFVDPALNQLPTELRKLIRELLIGKLEGGQDD
ncbi:MAG: Fe-S cluster assembly protein SufD [Candidatus Zixiibacteriota bacterium]|nr:MAG: Fe-S cluster assembly protein SufD [candidate division Zixibacteria bacterium]